MHDHHPEDAKSMPSSAALDLELSNKWTKFLERREAARSEIPVIQARERVASRAQVAPGTLTNIRNGRLKFVAGFVRDRLKAAFIRELEAEIRYLTHELHLLKATGADPRDGEIETVLAGINTARSALGLPPITEGGE